MKVLELSMNQWNIVVRVVNFIRGRTKCWYSVSTESTQMQLTPIAANQTQLNLNDGTEVFFSYETPVAAKLPNYDYIRTATKWSQTTTKHINQWLSLIHI